MAQDQLGPRPTSQRVTGTQRPPQAAAPGPALENLIAP
jgi:hypothetical protein